MCTVVSFREKGEKGGPRVAGGPICLFVRKVSLSSPRRTKNPVDTPPPFPSLGRSEKVSPRKADNSVQLTVSPFFPSRKKGEEPPPRPICGGWDSPMWM